MKDLAEELLELEGRLNHSLGVADLSRVGAPPQVGGLEYCLAVGLMGSPKMFLRGPDPHLLVAEANAYLDLLPEETESAGAAISWGFSIGAVFNAGESEDA